MHEWHELLDNAAALILTVGGAVYLVRAWRAARDLGGPRLPPDGRRSIEAALGQPVNAAARPAQLASGLAGAVVVAVLSLGAAVIHLAAAPAHLVELGVVGAGFLVAAAFQAIWAGAWLVRPSRALALFGIAGNLAISAAWMWTRTVGLPVGPDAFTPEPIGTADAVATAFQLLIAGLLVAGELGLGRRAAGRLWDARTIMTIAVVPAIGIVLLATTLAVTALAVGDQDHGGGHDQGLAADHSH